MKHASTVWRDLVLLALLGVTVAVVLVIPWINPKATPKEKTPPGQLIVQIGWPQGDVDVDLWVKAPNEKPVGFSSKSSKDCNLLRDDLGNEGDPTKANYEITFCRSTPAGEYVVNVMLYADRAQRPPIPVSVHVDETKGGRNRRLLSRHVTLSRVGQQLTVWRFTLGSHGQVVSTNRLPMNLYSAQ